MEKVKSKFIPNLLNILKCSLLAVTVTLVGIVLLAVVLKFVDLSSSAIEWINNVIKIFAIFILVMSIKKTNDGKLLVKSVIGGVVYAVLSFLVFSILNGNVEFSLNFVYDLLFAVIVSVIVTIISNILQRKNV